MKPSTDTILFVHGMCHGAWCWEEHFVPYFERLGFQCVAISLPGHEKAGKVDEIHRYTLTDYVKCVARAVAEIGQTPIIIGHSMGGMVVQHYLKTNSAKKVVLLAPVPPSGALRASTQAILKHPGIIKHLLVRDLLGFGRAYPHFFFGNEMGREQLEVYRSQLCSESFTAYLQLLIPLPRPSVPLPSMLVVGGDRDSFFTMSEFEHTADRYQATLAIVEGGCHGLMLGPRQQQVADLIADWLGGNEV